MVLLPTRTHAGIVTSAVARRPTFFPGGASMAAQVPTVNVIIVTRESGPNFLPVGTFNDRPVEHSYALGSPAGDWRYTDNPRGWINPREIVGMLRHGDYYPC